MKSRGIKTDDGRRCSYFAVVIAVLLVTGSCATYRITGLPDGYRPDLVRSDELYYSVTQSVPMGRSNDKGDLGWNESYIWISLIQMYEVTKDQLWLDRLVARIEPVLATRDDVLGLPDEYRKKTMPSWGSSKYSGGTRTTWLVHASMLHIAMARFARIVFEEGLDGYVGRAEGYLASIKETINAYEEDWSEKEGWYMHPVGAPVYDTGAALPLNVNAATGIVMAELYGMCRGDEYVPKIEAMAAMISRWITRYRDGTLSWKYLPSASSRIEDATHGAITAAFLAAAAREGLAFDGEIVDSACATFLAKLVRSRDELAASMDGFGSIPSSVAFAWGMAFEGRASEPLFADYLAESVFSELEPEPSVRWALGYAAWRSADSRSVVKGGR
jgi:hypothetical protein